MYLLQEGEGWREKQTLLKGSPDFPAPSDQKSKWCKSAKVQMCKELMVLAVFDECPDGALEGLL